MGVLEVAVAGSSAEVDPTSQIAVADVAADDHVEQRLDQIVDRVAALLDQHGISKAVIGGVSMGGYTTMALLRSNPERARAIILIDTQMGADDEAGKIIVAWRIHAGHLGRFASDEHHTLLFGGDAEAAHHFGRHFGVQLAGGEAQHPGDWSGSAGLESALLHAQRVDLAFAQSQEQAHLRRGRSVRQGAAGLGEAHVVESVIQTRRLRITQGVDVASLIHDERETGVGHQLFAVDRRVGDREHGVEVTTLARLQLGFFNRRKACREAVELPLFSPRAIVSCRNGATPVVTSQTAG
ncbi:MAG: alpha/beta hydrolase [Aquincola sp.]|nr:alpha/beta hydrolase [Aquincola sp.]